MAVTLQSATRQGPPGCQHYIGVLDIDGVRTITVSMTIPEFDEPITDDDVRSFLKVWGRYNRARGESFSALVGAKCLETVTERATTAAIKGGGGGRASGQGAGLDR